jgi:hypothetical protein
MDRIRLTSARASVWFRTSVIKRRYEPLNKIEGFKQTQGTETSQYLEERTSKETPVVVASEPGPGQCSCEIKSNDLERSAIAGDSPVDVKQQETRVGRDT